MLPDTDQFKKIGIYNCMKITEVEYNTAQKVSKAPTPVQVKTGVKLSKCRFHRFYLAIAHKRRRARY